MSVSFHIRRRKSSFSIEIMSSRSMEKRSFRKLLQLRLPGWPTRSCRIWGCPCDTCSSQYSKNKLVIPFIHPYLGFGLNYAYLLRKAILEPGSRVLMQHSSGFSTNLGVDYDLYLFYRKNEHEDGCPCVWILSGWLSLLDRFFLQCL